jgi:diadenylate cyclase
MFETLTFPQLTWPAALDIFIIAFVIYQVLMFMKGTRGVQMAMGIALVVGFYYFARWARLDTVSWLLTNILPYTVFIVVVLFQSEIRRALTHFGKAAALRGIGSISRNNELYDEIVLAVTTLASNQTGALIIMERDIGLKTYVESGIAMDAAISYDLLVTIFNPSAPLHDGAVIVQNARIAAAACFLPLTVKPRLSKELGTRHRAAIGVTEETDAIAIIVSEETGSIAFAHDGEIERFLDPDTLRLRLRDAFERRFLRHSRAASAERVEDVENVDS